MARTFRFKLVVVAVASLFAAGALGPAFGSPSGSDRALVAQFRRPGVAHRETAMVALTKTKANELPHQTFDFDYYAR